MLEVIFAIIIIPLLFFALASFFKTIFLKNFEDTERFVFSFALSFPFLVLILLFFQIIKLAFLFRFAVIFLVILLGYLAFKRKISLSRETAFLIIIFFVQYIFRLAFHQYFPTYPISADWWGYYINSLETYYSPFNYTETRTPFYHNVVNIGMHLFNNSFWVAQLMHTFTTTAILFPAYLVLKNFFNKKTAQLSIIFMSVAFFFTFQSIFMWQKLLAGFFALLFIYCLLKDKIKLGALFAGLSYLTHTYTVFYIIPGIIYYIIKNKKDLIKRKKQIIFAVIIFLVCLSPWWIFNLTKYGKLEASTFIYYPLCVGLSDDDFKKLALPALYPLHGRREAWDMLRGSNGTQECVKNFLNTSLETKFIVRYLTLLRTVLPSFYNFMRLDGSYFLRGFPGAISSFLAIIAYLSCFCLLYDKERRLFVISFIGLPLLGIFLHTGFIDWGYVMHGMVPLIVLLLGCSLYFLTNLTKHKLIILIAFLFCFLEMYTGMTLLNVWTWSDKQANYWGAEVLNATSFYNIFKDSLKFENTVFPHPGALIIFLGFLQIAVLVFYLFKKNKIKISFQT